MGWDKKTVASCKGQVARDKAMNSETIIIKVGMGGGVVAASPQVIISEGIGSCVVLTLYDLRLRTGGLAHIMLPRRETTTKYCTPYQFADTAVHELFDSLLANGSRELEIEGKIAGGAKMFLSNNGDYSIGRLNIESVKAALEAKRICLAAWDIGGHHGRNVEFHLSSGRMIIRAIGKEDKEI